jgi:hypothetical protein
MEVAISISWLGVLIAAVAKFFIGFAWYSPILFVKPWLELTGLTNEKVQAGLMRALIAEGVGNLIMAYVLARFIAHYGSNDLVGGAFIGFMAWLGFVATVFANQIFYEQKPQQLIFINGGYMLVSLIVMGGIIGILQ